MIECLDEAKEELKRANHLLYVSLKYTRTVNVFRSFITRIIAMVDCGMNSLLKKAKDDGKIEEIPTIPKIRCDELLKIYPNNQELKEFIDFYLMLRIFNRTKSFDREEFRRHVTMAMVINDVTFEVNIDNLVEYYDEAEKFIDFVKKEVTGVHDET